MALSGALTYEGYFTGFTPDRPRHIFFSPGGEHAYLLEFDDDQVSWLDVNATTGALTYVGAYVSSNLDGAQYGFCSADGNHVYICSLNNDSISWFTRNSTTGALTYVGQYSNSNIDQPYWTGISADDDHVYVCANAANAVAWFSRNTTTGALTYTDRYQSTTYCYQTRGGALTHDAASKHFYCTGRSSDNISWFTRNDTTGALTVVDRYYSATLLNQPVGLCLDSDDDNVYVCAQTSGNGSLSWFDRNDTTGALTYNDYSDTNLTGANWCSISSNDGWVYVTGGGRVLWLSRDDSTGDLTDEGNYFTALSTGAYIPVINEDFLYVPTDDSNRLIWFSGESAAGSIYYYMMNQ